MISLLAGMSLLIDWPLSGARAIGLLVGVSLISKGWAVLRVHRAAETAANRLRGAVESLATAPRAGRSLP